MCPPPRVPDPDREAGQGGVLIPLGSKGEAGTSHHTHTREQAQTPPAYLGGRKDMPCLPGMGDMAS